MKLYQPLVVLFFFTTLFCGSVAFAQTRVNYRTVPLTDSAVGMASFYADKFVGRKTANGEVFSQEKLTCAHNTLPFGTRIKVTNLKNEKSVVVRVNDRLHHRNSRLVDLSRSAAGQLGLIGAGIIRVKVEVIKEEGRDSAGLNK